MAITIRDITVINTAPEGINLVVVKVSTSEPELYGLGCATYAYRHVAVEQVVNDYFKPLLVGRDVSNIEETWRLMNFNAYWRNGPILNNAMSGIDMALWDIKGKMANMPLYQLFGGKSREGVAIYRHADGADLVEICDNIQRYADSGIKCIRCQLGGYGGSGYGKAPISAPKGAMDGIYLDSKSYIKNTIELFDGIRAKVGYDVDLCHDVHERLDYPDAMKLLKGLEPYQLAFLEDLVPLEHLDWLDGLRPLSSTPLALGELFNNPIEWKTVIEKHLIDYIRIHISQVGGITQSRKIQMFAEQYGVDVSWHGPGDLSPVGHAANVHIDIASPNIKYQEWSGTEPPNFVIQKLSGPNEALLDVFEGLPQYFNGYVYPNEKAGLGITINEKEAAKYPCTNETTKWTQTRRFDGTMQQP